jgi:hypothetical protein
MFCQKCGREVEENAKYCPNCGYNFVQEEAKKVSEKGRYIDEEGFTRKTRDSFGILIWFIAGAILVVVRYLSSEYDFLTIIAWPIFSYLIYLSIKMYSSHDIETWKHSNHIKLWIYVGGLIAGLVAVIAYYYLKGKERKYLATTHNHSSNMS